MALTTDMSPTLPLDADQTLAELLSEVRELRRQLSEQLALTTAERDELVRSRLGWARVGKLIGASHAKHEPVPTQLLQQAFAFAKGLER